MLFGIPGTVYVRRRVGEEYHPQCVLRTIKGGGGSTMIWGCMATRGVGNAFICRRRMNSATYVGMLEQVLNPSINKIFEEDVNNVIFQQDSAPCHTARSSTAWFRENGIKVLDWPPRSPDLTIQHLWSVLKEKSARLQELVKMRSGYRYSRRIEQAAFQYLPEISL
ncbi:transposable element-related [Holotrichia oblita]|uniref:Transposable element-related n=1 Tax=Holotrichia oblita TaxID=644536 RepID=A0ACB9SN42_HOLOL|nr:transposable element-related [Holotrichia oblita]